MLINFCYSSNVWACMYFMLVYMHHQLHLTLDFSTLGDPRWLSYKSSAVLLNLHCQATPSCSSCTLTWTCTYTWHLIFNMPGVTYDISGQDINGHFWVWLTDTPYTHKSVNVSSMLIYSTIIVKLHAIDTHYNRIKLWEHVVHAALHYCVGIYSTCGPGSG